MRLLAWFRRTRPTPPPPLPTSERVIAALHGYTPEQWVKLPEHVRRDCRDGVAWELQRTKTGGERG